MPLFIMGSAVSSTAYCLLGYRRFAAQHIISALMMVGNIFWTFIIMRPEYEKVFEESDK